MAILSIDLGTTNTKVMLFEESTGTILGSAQYGYPIMSDESGKMEQNPHDWWNAVCLAIRECLSQSPAGKEDIRVIGLSGQMVGFVPMGANKKPLANVAIHLDSRCLKEINIMQDDERLMSVGNNKPSTITTAPRLLWFKNNYRDLWEEMAVWLYPKDYIRFCLTGVMATEISDASGSLFMDFYSHEWSDLAEDYGLDLNKFPKVYNSLDVLGEVKEEAAGQTGLKAGTPVVAGAADMACAAIGTNAISEGAFSVTIGTVGHLIAPISSPKKKYIESLFQLCHAIPGLYYAFGAIPAGGFSFGWLKDVFSSCCASEDMIDKLSMLAKDVTPLSNGLFFLPYLTGAQMPVFDPNASGVFFGLRPYHNAGHMARAVMEGVAYVFRQMIESFESKGIAKKQIYLGDGGCRSEAWVNSLTNIIGCPNTYLMRNLHSSTLGAAIIAGAAVGIYKDIEESAKALAEYTRVEKDDNSEKRYAQGYQLFCSLYPALRETYEQHSSLKNFNQ